MELIGPDAGEFKDAVETVAHENFDLVLYAQNWEFGGNGDSKGFINALVNQATQAGVIWMQVSGGGTAGPIDVSAAAS